MSIEKTLDDTSNSMMSLKKQIEADRLKDVFEAMKFIKEEDRSDFFKAYYSELNWRLNDPLNEKVIYKKEVDKLNKK